MFKRLAAVFFFLISSVAVAQEAVVTLEEPVKGGIASGITNIRGWAVADAGVDRIELFINGQFYSEIPYGGKRRDVESAFPSILNSINSGFGQTYNYNALGTGQHTFTVRAYMNDGQLVEDSAEFTVAALPEPFYPDSAKPDFSRAAVSIDKTTGKVSISDVSMDSGELVDLELSWSTPTQGYAITSASEMPPGETVTESEYNDLNSTANVFTAPARIVGNLSSLTDEDWFELSTDRNNRMIDVTFSSLPNNSPGNQGRWQVEWYGKQCPDKEGVTLSRRNLAISDEGFTYSVPACELGVYRVAIRVPQNYSYFHDSGEYSLQISLSDWP